MKLDLEAPPEGTVRDWLAARAETAGDAILFPETGRRLSWQELNEGAHSYASGLIGLGAEKGESVAIVVPNNRDSVIALYGALVGGFRATMINLAVGRDAISCALERSEARFAFIRPDASDLFDAANSTRIRPVDLSETVEASLHEIEAADHALLMYTSGTTEHPKGVVHTHASLLAGGWTTAIAHGLTERDRGFAFSRSIASTVFA